MLAAANQPTDPIGVLLGLVVAALVAALYMLPTIVARSQRAPDLGMVAVVNVLLGWTFVGWVVAFVMALRKPSQPTVVVVQQQLTTPPGWYTVDGVRRWWDGTSWR